MAREGQETPGGVCMYRNGRNCWEPNSQVVCTLTNLGKELNYIIPTSCSVSPANPFSVQTLGEDGSLENAMARKVTLWLVFSTAHRAVMKWMSEAPNLFCLPVPSMVLDAC